MRRLRIGLVVLALAAVAADVAVSARAPSVTVRPASISYGQSIVLQAKLARARRGQSVEVLAHGCGFTKAVVVETLKVRRGGSVRYVAAPAFNTKYSVRWRGRTSPVVRVRVAPVVSVRKSAADRYDVQVGSGGGSTFEGKTVRLQRRENSRWRTIADVSLKLTSPPTALDAVSSGSYTGRIERNLTLRAVLPQAQAGRCYQAATSSLIKS